MDKKEGPALKAGREFSRHIIFNTQYMPCLVILACRSLFSDCGQAAA
jgi:hypothetical protein